MNFFHINIEIINITTCALNIRCRFFIKVMRVPFLMGHLADIGKAYTGGGKRGFTFISIVGWCSATASTGRLLFGNDCYFKCLFKLIIVICISYRKNITVIIYFFGISWQLKV